MPLAEDQEKIHDEIIGELKKFFNFEFSNDQFEITIGGYAGTGKTYLISELRKSIKSILPYARIAFATFTGKASSVLKSKLLNNNCFFRTDYCGTIHGLIYAPKFSYDKLSNKMVIIEWVKLVDLEYDIIIIDEASMVSREIYEDLKSYGIPIIFVGDHGQLPPISATAFNLMDNLTYSLSTIKRQALDNPIIKLSMDIRNGKEIPFGFFDDNNKSVFKIKWKTKDCNRIFENVDFKNQDVLTLCAFNKTRVAVNKIIRKLLDFNRDEPYPGERIICLRNNHTSKIMNGQLATVLFLKYAYKNFYNITLQMDGFDDPYNGLVYNKSFNVENYGDIFEIIKSKSFISSVKKTGYNQADFFDFGYVTTVHKSQGSEYDKIILFQEMGYWDTDYKKRWLYSAVTRAKNKLMIISP